MEVPDTMNPGAWLRKHLEADGGTDLIREMVKAFAEVLMSAEASAMCGAAYNERSDERVNSRNGYRARAFDTRAGSMALAIPKLREGSYFPDWLVAPRRRAERALVAVVAQCYVEGVSTRRVDDVVRAMGIDGISASQVSEMAKSLDTVVEDFRNRPLDGGPYAYVALDALTQRVREGGRCPCRSRTPRRRVGTWSRPCRPPPPPRPGPCPVWGSSALGGRSRRGGPGRAGRP